ncbi:MAG: response regulator [Pseudomonadota bacterium]
MADTKTKILCVDDEPHVLEGLSLHLRRHYDVLTASGGVEALDILGQEKDIAVIMSDMRMPGMDGATLLAEARQAAPDTVRLLLTGQADMESTIAAINEGQIFRLLIKPCRPTHLLSTMQAAVEQYRLITAERILLEQTLHGTVKTLTDVLGLTNPIAFGRATRIKKHVSDLATKLDIKPRWQVEVAAMLSQLASITLPSDLVEKIYAGRPLDEQDQEMIAHIPVVTEQLLKNIPRLEVVRGILAGSANPYRPPTPGAAGSADASLIARGAEILRVATDFNVLEAQGMPAVVAVETLRSRAGNYDSEVLDALALLKCGPAPKIEIREVSIAALHEGMIVAEDIKTADGMLMVARGQEITAGFLERLRNDRSGSVRDPLRIIARPGQRLSE